jgi:hypothetical protein
MKFYQVILFVTKRIFFVTVFSVLLLTLSQLFLIMAYLLPIKILILLSIENIPDILNTIFYGLEREPIILILSFLVFVMYCLHLVLEKVITIVIEKNFRFLLNDNIVAIRDIFVKRFLENFLRLLATVSLVFLLFCILLYIFPIIAVALLVYLFIVIGISFAIKIQKEQVIKFFHISFFLGFIVIFIYEVIYLLYYNTEEVSIITILISIVVVRYIFLRGVFIINKLLIVYKDLNTFYKKSGK